MISWLRDKISLIALGVGSFILALACIWLYLRWDNARDTIASIATELASSEETVEITKNLYAKKVHENEGLLESLEKMKREGDAEVAALVDQLKRAEQRILTLNSLVVKWKSAYEGLLETTQTEEPGEDGTIRKRVDFKKDFGYIGVTGHTLTDPPEGFIKVEQLRPLRLTLVVTKNRNGTWSSLVSSSEDNVGVDIDVTGIDLSVIKPKWYQRIWGEVGLDPLGDQSVSAGLSYQLDTWSLGAECRLGRESNGCGLRAGFRIFK